MNYFDYTYFYNNPKTPSITIIDSHEFTFFYFKSKKI